eukprot:5247232-Pleurochrysis_carterae.AAC.1
MPSLFHLHCCVTTGACAQAAGASASPSVQAASSLLNLDAESTSRLLTSFKREAHNDALAYERAASAPSTPRKSELLMLLPIELRLLRFMHKQRCLLLRTLQQLLAISFKGDESDLHDVVAGKVSLLLRDGLAARLSKLSAQLRERVGGERDAQLRARLPERLREVDTPTALPAAAVAEARHEWITCATPKEQARTARARPRYAFPPFPRPSLPRASPPAPTPAPRAQAPLSRSSIAAAAAVAAAAAATP